MDALSPADKKRIERSLTKISNTLISKAEGYNGSNHLLHDLRQDYDLDGRQLAIQCGFASFEEFMASDYMKKYARVEGQGANFIYKPAYDPCMQHIVDEMLKSRSDVLRRNELKESREAARNSNINSYTNNSAARPFSQDSLNRKNNYSSLTGNNQTNNFNQHPPAVRQQQQQPWPKSAPRPLMSIVVPREGEMYRSTQRNNFTAVLPNGIDATENSATSGGQAAYLPNGQVGNNQSYHPVEPVARTAAAEDSVQKPVRNVFDIGSSGQQNVNAGMIVEKNRKCLSVSNDFVICNSPTSQSASSPPSSSPAPVSSAPKKQTSISINWNLDDEDDDDDQEATQQSQISARKNSSSDEWDFGELEISNPAVKPAPVISPKIVASSPYPTNGFSGTNYNRRHHNETYVAQPTTSQSKAPAAKPSLPGVQTRKTPQPEPAPERRKFQRAPDTSPPTNYTPSTATARVSLAAVKNPILWLGDLEKQKIEEEKTQRLRMETAKSNGSSSNQPFNAPAFAAVQSNRKVRNGALPARFTANDLRSTPFFSGTAEDAKKNAQTRLPTRSAHVNTSYNGTGYRTKEEYDNRLELSDSD